MYFLRFSLIFFSIICRYFLIPSTVIVLKFIHNLTSCKIKVSGSSAHLGKFASIVRLLLILSSELTFNLDFYILCLLIFIAKHPLLFS